MKKICFGLCFILLALLSSCSKDYILDTSFEGVLIRGPKNPYDSEIINNLCNYDLSEKRVTLEKTLHAQTIMTEPASFEYFESTDQEFFRLQLTCFMDSTMFYYVNEETSSEMIGDLFFADDYNLVYEMYEDQMEYLYDINILQTYGGPIPHLALVQLDVNEEEERLYFAKDATNSGYECYTEATKMTCSDLVYNAVGSSTDPARTHHYEIITVEIIFGEPVYDAIVDYYIFKGCHEESTTCDHSRNYERTHTVAVSNLSYLINVSRDPDNRRTDSRDFYQTLSSFIEVTSTIN